MARKKKRIKPLELILTVIPLVLFIFFVLSLFHNWANSLTTKLHFCNHTACIVFSIIWLIFALIGIYYLFSKNKMSFLWIIAYLVVLVVGIVLMNMTYCDLEGNMHFKEGNLFKNLLGSELTGLGSGESSSGGSHEVDEPPCSDSDRGRDYEVRGWITPLTPSVSDICLETDILREMYCDSDLTYTSEDINCTDEFGEEYVCDDGRCARKEDDGDGEVETETNCGDGIDNDDDQLTDCEDPDCADICGDLEYSCHVGITDYPSCGGTCPPGEECIVYNSGDGTLDGGWCDCMPSTETACYGSESCGGWCGENYVCTVDSFGCYCKFDTTGDCEDTDGGIDYLVGGFSVENNPEFGILNFIEYCGWEKGDEYTLYEYYCLYGEATPIEIDCTTLGLVCIEDPVDGSYCGNPTY